MILKTIPEKNRGNPDGLMQRTIKAIKNAVPEDDRDDDVALDPVF